MQVSFEDQSAVPDWQTVRLLMVLMGHAFGLCHSAPQQPRW